MDRAAIASLPTGPREQRAGAKDNNSPPSSRHTNGIPVAGVSWPKVRECLFNTGVLENVSHLGTNGSPLLPPLAASE